MAVKLFRPRARPNEKKKKRIKRTGSLTKNSDVLNYSVDSANAISSIH